MLDSNDTETTPYDTCPQRPITIPLNFYSWYGTPIINCSGMGLEFEETVEIRGLKFLDTFLRIHEYSLTIDNCFFGNFLPNTAFEYLINVRVTKLQRNPRINITNTNFLEKNNAGALSVVTNRKASSVFVEIRNITVSHNFLSKKNFVISTQGHVNLNVRIFNCSFISNNIGLGGGIITVSSHSLTLSVEKCNFSGNNATAVCAKTSLNGVVVVRNSFVKFGTSKRPSESLCGAQVCVMFYDSNDTCVTSSGLWDTSTGTHLCGPTHFSDSNESLEIPGVWWKDGVKDAFKFWSENKNTKWLKNGHGPQPDNSLKLPTLPHPGLTVEDCQFRNNTSSDSYSAVIEVHLNHSQTSVVTMANLQVRRSAFKGNLASDGNGAIYTAQSIGCNISDSIFVENNGGKGAGAIDFLGTTMFLSNCTLDSNNGGSIAKTQAIGSVSISNMGRAFILNSRIIQRSSFRTVRKKGYHGTLAISSDLFEELVLSNSTLDMRWSPSQEKVIVLEIGHTKSFVLENGTSIKCPWGYSIKHTTKRLKTISQSFECILCTMGSYTIERGVYR